MTPTTTTCEFCGAPSSTGQPHGSCQRNADRECRERRASDAATRPFSGNSDYWESRGGLRQELAAMVNEEFAAYVRHLVEVHDYVPVELCDVLERPWREEAAFAAWRESRKATE